MAMIENLTYNASELKWQHTAPWVRQRCVGARCRVAPLFVTVLLTNGFDFEALNLICCYIANMSNCWSHRNDEYGACAALWLSIDNQFLPHDDMAYIYATTSCFAFTKLGYSQSKWFEYNEKIWYNLKFTRQLDPPSILNVQWTNKHWASPLSEGPVQSRPSWRSLVLRGRNVV